MHWVIVLATNVWLARGHAPVPSVAESPAHVAVRIGPRLRSRLTACIHVDLAREGDDPVGALDLQLQCGPLVRYAMTHVRITDGAVAWGGSF
jgi:hypothetical protein